MVLMAGATVARDATGDVADMVNGSFAFLNCTGSKYKPSLTLMPSRHHLDFISLNTTVTCLFLIIIFDKKYCYHSFHFTSFLLFVTFFPFHHTV